MKESVEKGLTTGLVNGYVSESKPQRVERHGFRGKGSSLKIGTRLQYRDEWFAGERLGGGQELVDADGEKGTRLYAGGTVDDETLSKLGITEEEVTGFLRETIGELGDATRLGADCSPKGKGGWKYNYRVVETDEALGLTIGLETITYRRREVFAHAFIISPIE